MRQVEVRGGSNAAQHNSLSTMQVPRSSCPTSCTAIWPGVGFIQDGVHRGDRYDIYGGFLKWWYPTIMGFPTKNDHFGVFSGYHNSRKHPYISKWPYKIGNWGYKPLTAYNW